MPYAIAVLALIVMSVGFTLFQSQGQVANNDSESPSIVRAEAAVGESVATSTQTVVTNIIDEVTAPETPQSEPIPQETKPRKETPTNPAPAPTPTPVPTPTPAPAVVYDYKNGTYRTQQSYRTPGGQYQMDLSVTVTNDKVTNTTLSFGAGGGDGYSKRFNTSYQSQIVGQDLGTVSLSRVGGASLTTKAFNTVINTIKSQATS